MPTPLEIQYTASMNDKERLALQIARDQLGSSFSLSKSNGMTDWSKRTARQPPTPPTAPNPPTTK